VNLLLTGGSGFIGHHTVEHLLKNTDWNIVVLDALTYAGDVNKVTDVGVFDPARVRVVWHDLRAPVMDSLVERIGNVDYVINMASESHVDRSIADPVPFVQNNIALVLHMLEYARQVQPTKFIQISTDEVYGPAPIGYDFAEWDTMLPSNPYAASKAAQESIAVSYWRTYGTPVAIVNAMNAFGERQHPEKFIPLTIDHLRNGRTVPVHAEWVGDAWEPGSRYWLHARNIADALVFLLREVEFDRYPDADRPSKYHVVGTEELDNLEVVTRIAAILEVEPRVEFVDFHTERPGHDRRYALDGSKLAAAGWKPPYSFDRSLRQTVAWMGAP